MLDSGLDVVLAHVAYALVAPRRAARPVPLHCRALAEVLRVPDHSDRRVRLGRERKNVLGRMRLVVRALPKRHIHRDTSEENART